MDLEEQVKPFWRKQFVMLFEHKAGLFLMLLQQDWQHYYYLEVELHIQCSKSQLKVWEQILSAIFQRRVSEHSFYAKQKL